MRIPTITLGLMACLLSGVPKGVVAQNGPVPQREGYTADQEAKQAADLDLEQLANVDVKVTSASKKSESLFQAPAAIHVLTGEDIRRGGFATLPEALRMVPGLYVAQSNSHAWQISARGFSGVSNNKMLVLIDGRSVYTPAFGGVYWDMQDVPLENVERIEVIGGPGGALWGANAVNGVINVVTKHTNQTRGAMVSTSYNSDIGYTSTVQFGGQATPALSYRLYGRASYWEPFSSPSGQPLANSFALPQAGMRVDWAASQADTVSVAGSVVNGRFQGSAFLSPVVVGELLKDANVLLRWTHTFSSRSSAETFAYCDWFAHQGFPDEKRNNCNFEFQHNFAFDSRHSLIWGGSFLTTADVNTQMQPVRRRARVESGFVQYEYVVVPGHFRVLAGSKFEGNQFSGIEYQPQVRGVWSPNKSHALWGSFSRAVRDPARSESDLDTILSVFPSPGGTVTTRIRGNPHLQSERVRAYELGYRFQPKQMISFDLATYYNSYSNLITFATSAVEVVPQGTVITLSALNGTSALGGTAQTHGAVLSVQWRPIQRWMISPSVTETRGSAGATSTTPRHLFQIQSRLDLPRDLYLDAALYHYNALPPQSPPGFPPVAGVATFNRVDLGLSWRIGPHWTIAAWGRNLQSDRHVETASDFFGGATGAIPRSFALNLVWRSGRERSSAP